MIYRFIHAPRRVFRILLPLVVSMPLLLAGESMARKRSLRIMPMGNSITAGDNGDVSTPAGDKTGYRYRLYQLLTACGAEFEFAGSEYYGFHVFSRYACAAFPGMLDHELRDLLRTGRLSSRFTDRNPIVTSGPYLDVYAPDIILLHIGTNAVRAGSAEVEEILYEIDAYEARSQKEVVVFLARIINRNPYSLITTLFNDSVENMARQRIAIGDNIVIVDMEDSAGIDYSTEMEDDLHPDSVGYAKMADCWFRHLRPLLHSYAQTGNLRLNGDNHTAINNWHYNPRNYQKLFNRSAAIRFKIPFSAHIRLEIIHSSGRKIAGLVNGRRDPKYQSSF